MIDGIAGVVSQCGRHLAMMPHPERCFLPWQCPDKSASPEKYATNCIMEDSNSLPTAPWAKLFQNAYDWCNNNGKYTSC